LAERKVLKRVNPEYPEWARALDVGGAVVLSFTVSPDGRVMNDIQVENSTVEALNPVAVDALRRWRFAPLDPGDTEIQKGNIIMIFSLR
jgi:protein TonB